MPDRLLPVYTVLVPLLREANVLPGLVQSLRALDYPPAKLEIFLVLEAVDTETQAAVLELALPGNFRSLVVPDSGPHTKPKALNYALQFARGDYVVVYDAEDRPQPGQLRRAWDVFRRAPPELAACRRSSTSTIRARAGSPAVLWRKRHKPERLSHDGELAMPEGYRAGIRAIRLQAAIL